MSDFPTAPATETIAVSATTGMRVELFERELAGPLRIMSARHLRPGSGSAPHVAWAIHDDDRRESGWQLNIAQRVCELIAIPASQVCPLFADSEEQARVWIKIIAGLFLYAYEGQS